MEPIRIAAQRLGITLDTRLFETAADLYGKVRGVKAANSMQLAPAVCLDIALLVLGRPSRTPEEIARSTGGSAKTYDTLKTTLMAYFREHHGHLVELTLEAVATAAQRPAIVPWAAKVLAAHEEAIGASRAEDNLMLVYATAVALGRSNSLRFPEVFGVPTAQMNRAKDAMKGRVQRLLDELGKDAGYLEARRAPPRPVSRPASRPGTPKKRPLCGGAAGPDVDELVLELDVSGQAGEQAQAAPMLRRLCTGPIFCLDYATDEFLEFAARLRKLA